MTHPALISHCPSFMIRSPQKASGIVNLVFVLVIRFVVHMRSEKPKYVPEDRYNHRCSQRLTGIGLGYSLSVICPREESSLPPAVAELLRVRSNRMNIHS